MKKWFLSNVELQTGIPSLYVEFNFWVQCCEFIFRMFPSFINLFPVFSFYDKINFFYNWSCRQEPSFSAEWLFLLEVLFLPCTSTSLYNCTLPQLCLQNLSNQLWKSGTERKTEGRKEGRTDESRYRVAPQLKNLTKLFSLYLEPRS